VRAVAADSHSQGKRVAGEHPQESESQEGESQARIGA
jgi:hypothetical protein